MVRADGATLMATGLLLAGGRSTRFAEGDKAVAPLDGIPLIAHVAEGLPAEVDELLVSCRPEQTDRIREALSTVDCEYRFIVDTDAVGPLGGIRDGLRAAATAWTYVVGCDFPLVDPVVFETLAGHDGSEAVVFEQSDDTPQPLCGRYRTAAAADAAATLLPDCRRAAALLSALETKRLSAADAPFDVRRLQNVNTVAERDALTVREPTTLL
jgi:molybdopterin-guanine dinucleotide biosynthesis protein A